jgi:hypothetical protein
MDRLEKPHEVLVQSDQAKAVGVRDWPGLDMQAVNDKNRQEASSAGRRFGRMTCGRCVALHPSFYPEAWPGLGIGGCSASSDPLPAGAGGPPPISDGLHGQDLGLCETAVLRLQTLTGAEQTLVRAREQCGQVQ